MPCLSILGLPVEIIEHILTFTDPLTLSRVSQTCSVIHALIYGYNIKSKGKEKAAYTKDCTPDHPLEIQSQTIWRSLFLAELWDDPRVCNTHLGEELLPSRVPSAGHRDEGSSATKKGLSTRFDWRRETQCRFAALSFVQNRRWSNVSPSHLHQVLDTLISMALTTPPLSQNPETLEDEISRNLLSLARIPLAEFIEYFEEREEYRYTFESGLSRKYVNVTESLNEELGAHAATIRQRLGQLHVLAGLTLSDFSRKRLLRTRAFVYDMSKYHERNSWGPFTSKRTYSSQTYFLAGNIKNENILSVNWEHVLAVQHIMAMHTIAPAIFPGINLEGEGELDIDRVLDYYCDNNNDEADSGVSGGDDDEENPATQTRSHRNPQLIKRLSMLPFCQTQKTLQATDNDWVGVEGTYTCSFCFVDHRELLDYNADHLHIAISPLPISATLRSSSFRFKTEVFRSFPVQLRFVGTEPNPGGRFPDRPRVIFEGILGVRGRRNQDLFRQEREEGGQVMRGWVGVEGEPGNEFIRWSFTSGDNGEMIWSSEGVQIGPVQSTYGVLGTWTTVFHDTGDPVGPFWLRKALDTD